MRPPTKEQKTKEAAVLYTFLADLCLLSLLIVVALGTRSLTLMSEMIRASLILVIELYAIFTLRAVHRDQLQKFRFGIGKVEHTCHLAISTLLLISAVWIADHAIDTLLYLQDAATPRGLATAAAFNALTVLVNFISWRVVLAASRKDDSLIFQAQLRSRNTRFYTSVIVQATMTVAALARDPVVAIWFDALGAALVAGFILKRGLKMLMGSLPNLLDHPLPETTKRKIEAGLLSAGIAADDVVRMRTRRSGSIPHVELTLAPAGCESLADYSRLAEHVESRLKDELRGADVSVVVDTHEA